MFAIMFWSFIFLALAVAIVHFFIKGLILVGSLLLIIGLLIGGFMIILNLLAGLAVGVFEGFWKKR